MGMKKNIMKPFYFHWNKVRNQGEFYEILFKDKKTRERDGR